MKLELQARLREAWGLPGLLPLGETPAFRLWRSPFHVDGMNRAVAAIRAQGATVAAHDSSWGRLTAQLLRAALAAARIGDGPCVVRITTTGIACDGGILGATSSVPLLAVHLAQALLYTRSPLYGKTLVAYDLESTGVGATDEITEIGAVRIRDGVITEEFQTLVDPGQYIGPDIVELTGITNDMVRGAPSPAEAVRRFLDFFGGNDTIAVVHNGSFDLRTIRARASRFCRRDFTPTVYDTRAYCQSLRPLAGANLAELADDFGVRLDDHHRALADARATGEVFIKASVLANADWQVFRTQQLGLVVPALAAWDGTEGEEERALLHGLLTRRDCTLPRGLRRLHPEDFDRVRAALAAQAETIAAGTEVRLGDEVPRAVPVDTLACRAANAQLVRELAAYAPYLRHNPRPAFTVAGTVQEQGNRRHLRDATGQVLLAAGADPQQPLALAVQPHRWLGWLWPVPVLLPSRCAP